MYDHLVVFQLIYLCNLLMILQYYSYVDLLVDLLLNVFEQLQIYYNIINGKTTILKNIINDHIKI